MALSAEQAANLRKLAFDIRKNAYQCGYYEAVKGSMHEMAIKGRDEMEDASEAFNHYIDELLKGK